MEWWMISTSLILKQFYNCLTVYNYFTNNFKLIWRSYIFLLPTKGFWLPWGGLLYFRLETYWRRASIQDGQASTSA